MGADNLTRLLWNTGSGTFALWRVNADASVTAYPEGPFPGWSATQVALGADSVPRILWNKTDGSMSLWNFSESANTFTANTFGPYTGWAAKALAVGGDNVPRVLWNKTDGTMVLWSIDTSGSYTQTAAGPYSGWTASFLASGPNSVPCLLWTNAGTSSASLWVSADPAATHFTWPNPSGCTLLALAVDANNAPRILWNHPSDSTVAVWTVSTSNGSYTSQSYSYPSGCTPKGIAAAGDGSVRLLWNNPTGAGSVPAGSVQIGILLGDGTPVPTLNLVPTPANNPPQPGGAWVLDHYNFAGNWVVNGQAVPWPKRNVLVPNLGLRYNQDGTTTSLPSLNSGVQLGEQGTSPNAQTASGTITPVFVWSGKGSAPAGTVSVLVTPLASGFGYAGSGANVDDGFGDAATSSMFGGGFQYTSTGSHVVSVTVTAGLPSFTLPTPPTLTAKDTMTGYGGMVSMNAYVVNASLSGTTPVGTAQQALTGQQITASLNLNGVPGTVTGYTWSTSGATAPNPIKNWDPNAPGDGTPTQLVPLTSSDTSGTGPTVNSFSFYDEKGGDTVTVKCNLTLKLTDNTTQTVPIQFQPIKFLIPTASWTVNTPPPYLMRPLPANEQPGFYSDNASFMQAYEWWDPITITDPPNFSGGTGCLVQTTTPSRTSTRVPTGTGAPTYILKIEVPPGSGNWIKPVANGLDGMFPYPKGLADDGFGHDGNPVDNGYMWDVSVPGHSQDIPTLYFAPLDVDNGGTNWNYAYANDLFNTWLMYKPPAKGNQGNIWVPLQTLSWNWGGTANSSGAQWVTTAPAFSPGIPSTAKTYPSWPAITATPQQRP